MSDEPLRRQFRRWSAPPTKWRHRVPAPIAAQGLAMQDGETLGAHAETPVLLWNPEAQPSKLPGLGPKRLIERVVAVDERVQLDAAALLRQNAGDAFL